MITLVPLSDVLYAGGVLAGNLGSQGINDIFAYNLSEQDYASKQPCALEGNAVEVKIMTIKPNSKLLYMGGNIEKAGSIKCHSVCVYDSTSQNWSRPGTKLSGFVTYLTWSDPETLIGAGDIAVGGIPYSLATSYSPDGEWTPSREDQPIPGQITAMSPTALGGPAAGPGSISWSSDSTGFWIAGTAQNGTAFLMKWGNGTWQDVMYDLGFGKITGVEVMELDDATTYANNSLENGQILVLPGNLTIPEYNNVSAAPFNATSLWPLVLAIGADGDPGLSSQRFSERKTSFGSAPDPEGIVISIAVAILVVLVSSIITKK